MSLSDIVKISISRDTQAVAQAAFGIVNILGKNLNSTNRIEYFSTDDTAAIAAMLVGGTESAEYKAAISALSQIPKPSKIAISQAIAPKIITDNAGTYTAGAIKATVNGTLLTVAYNTNKATTLGDLATAIAGVTGIASAVYSGAGNTITITPAAGKVVSVAVDLSTVTGTMTMSLSSGVASELYPAALDNIKLEDNDWYGLILIDRTAATVEAVADWAEANLKVFCSASSDANIINQTLVGDTTSVAAYAKSAGLDRTAIIYHPDAATKYPDAGWLAGCLTRSPGSYTGMFKKISGSTVTKLTATQAKNALDKNCNIYELIGGVNMLREGTMGSGEYLDVIHFIDWFTARMMEGVFGLLARNPKIPYTPEGCVAIRGEMDKVGSLGISSGGLSKVRYDEDNVQIGGYYTIMPDFDSISANDKAERKLKQVKFKGFLAGAIHAVEIDGTITL